MLRGGFRIDGDHPAGTWMLTGEAYDGRLSQTMEDDASLTPPYGQMFDARFPEILQTILSSFHGAGIVATQGGGPNVWWQGFRA